MMEGSMVAQEDGRDVDEAPPLFPGGSVAADGSCRLVVFVPFTREGGFRPEETPDRGEQRSLAYSHLSSAVLAMQHFNDRDASVVPEIATEPTMLNCSVTFPIDDTAVADTEETSASAVSFLLRQTRYNNPMCAIVGPYFDTPTVEASIVASGLDIPLISHGSKDPSLSGERLHPMAVRTSVSFNAWAEAVISTLVHMGRTDFLSILAPLRDSEHMQSLLNAAERAGFKHFEHHDINSKFSGIDPRMSVRNVMKKIKESTYRTIVVAIRNYYVSLSFIADAAEEYGMNGDDYVWFLTSVGDVVDLEYVVSSDNMNITKLIGGAATVRLMDGFDYQPVSDPFLQSWNNQESEMVARVRKLNPIPEGKDGYYEASEHYFQTVHPEPGSGFMYDAIMSVGMGACKAEARARQEAAESYSDRDEQGQSSNEKGSEDGTDVRDRSRRMIHLSTHSGHPAVLMDRPNPISQRNLPKHVRNDKSKMRNKHLEGIVTSEFTGATGSVKYGERGERFKNRRRDMVTFGVYNIRKVKNEEMRQEKYGYFLTNIFHGSVNSGNWVEMPDGPFIFATGTSDPPVLLRDIPEQNYLSKGVRITGLTLMSISLFTIILAVIFIWRNSGKAIIRASQPVFLYTIAFGAAVISTSIFTLSFDEGVALTDSVLDVACVTTPWLVALGYIIIYCALFSKLWRINRVLQFTPRKVKAKNVAGPIAAFLVAAVVILALWTALDPLTWVRLAVDPETSESYGRCESQNAVAFFIPLVAIMVVSTVLTCIMAWKTKDIQKKFSESNWIFYTIFLQLQVFIVAIPILVILDDASADAAYLGRVLIVWTIPMSTILLIIGPKAATLIIPRQNETRPSLRGANFANGTVHVSGVSFPFFAPPTRLRTPPENVVRSSEPSGSTQTGSQSVRFNVESSDKESRKSSVETRNEEVPQPEAGSNANVIDDDKDAGNLEEASP